MVDSSGQTGRRISSLLLCCSIVELCLTSGNTHPLWLWWVGKGWGTGGHFLSTNEGTASADLCFCPWSRWNSSVCCVAVVASETLANSISPSSLCSIGHRLGSYFELTRPPSVFQTFPPPPKPRSSKAQCGWRNPTILTEFHRRGAQKQMPDTNWALDQN